MNKLDKAFKILALLNETDDSREGHLADAIYHVKAFIAYTVEKEPGLKLTPPKIGSEDDKQLTKLLVKMITKK